MSVNKVILLGNLGKDIELKHFDDGGLIGNFSLATNESYTNKQGEKITNTQWHNVVARNKQAEVLSKYVKKGDQLYVDGKLQTRKWQKDGQDQYTTEVVLLQFSFVGSKTDNQNTSSSTTKDDNDDLPF